MDAVFIDPWLKMVTRHCFDCHYAVYEPCLFPSDAYVSHLMLPGCNFSSAVIVLCLKCVQPGRN